MPFDPALPATGSDLDSAVIRSQLISLKALIDAIISITGAQVGGTTTLSPGLPATASVTLVGTTLSFTFGIPQGETGPPGEVTSAQLSAEIATTPRNPTSISPPAFSFSNPPTDSELYSLQSWLGDFYNALYRAP